MKNPSFTQWLSTDGLRGIRTPGPVGAASHDRAQARRGPLGYGLQGGAPSHGSFAHVATRSAGQQRLRTSSKIQVATLQVAFPYANRDHLERVAGDLNTNPRAYGLETPLRRAHFFAQVREEAGERLQGQVESFEYGPESLKRVFAYYREHPKEAEADGYGRDPKTRQIIRRAHEETIADNVYAGRNGNGGIASGDGWRYRGRGFIQVTGRGNYRALAMQYRVLYANSDVDFEHSPDQVAVFPYCLRSAVCFWVMHGLQKLADKGATDAVVDAITAVINKHTESYGARRSYFHAMWAAFK